MVPAAFGLRPRIDWATWDTICRGYPWRWQGPVRYMRRRWGTSQYSVGVQKALSAGLVLACGTASDRPLVWVT